MLEGRFGVSERRACAVVGQPRPTQRLGPPVPSDDEAELRRFLRAFATERPRWGWRRAYVAARDAGWRVNHKRVQRLWRLEGLKVPYRKRNDPSHFPDGSSAQVRRGIRRTVPQHVEALSIPFKLAVDA